MYDTISNDGCYAARELQCSPVRSGSKGAAELRRAFTAKPGDKTLQIKKQLSLESISKRRRTARLLS